MLRVKKAAGPRGSSDERAPPNTIVDGRHSVIKFVDAIDAVKLGLQDLAAELPAITEARAFRWKTQNGWTNPVLVTLDETSTIVHALFELIDGAGEFLAYYDTNNLSIENGARVYFHFLADIRDVMFDRLLGQSKKRQAGLFIKTKTRHPKHRGPKGDRLYIRVPHR